MALQESGIQAIRLTDRSVIMICTYVGTLVAEALTGPVGDVDDDDDVVDGLSTLQSAAVQMLRPTETTETDSEFGISVYMN
jgi:hypothetical protein